MWQLKALFGTELGMLSYRIVVADWPVSPRDTTHGTPYNLWRRLINPRRPQNPPPTGNHLAMSCQEENSICDLVPPSVDRTSIHVCRMWIRKRYWQSMYVSSSQPPPPLSISSSQPPTCLTITTTTISITIIITTTTIIRHHHHHNHPPLTVTTVKNSTMSDQGPYCPIVE